MRSLYALILASAACGRVGFAAHNDLVDAMPDAPAPRDVVHLSVGAFTSCALLGAGEAWCWGDGDAGALGDGDPGPHHTSVPMRVSGASTIVELDTNDGGTLARRADGSLLAWGANDTGAFGLGDSSVRDTAVAIPVTAKAMTLALSAACVVRPSGTVACAGTSSLLGTGETADRATFADAPVTDAIALTGGDDHICALLGSGAVACWGLDDQGQLGQPSAGQTPVIAGPGPYTQVAAGDRFTCALRPTGVVDCWGANATGALGDGSTTTRSTVQPVIGITTATMIACAAETACALLADHTVVCWGNNAERVLGDATPIYRAVPGPPVLTDVDEISAQSSTHVCAVKRDNGVWCWGANYRGQLGNPIADGVIGPVPVIGLP